MAKNEVLDEWIEWFKNLIKWTLKIIIGLIVLFYLINFICIITYDKCKNGISFKVAQVDYLNSNRKV